MNWRKILILHTARVLDQIGHRELAEHLRSVNVPTLDGGGFCLVSSNPKQPFYTFVDGGRERPEFTPELGALFPDPGADHPGIGYLAFFVSVEIKSKSVAEPKNVLTAKLVGIEP